MGSLHTRFGPVYITEWWSITTVSERLNAFTERRIHRGAPGMCLFLRTLRSFYGTERENNPRFGVITVFCNYGHYESVLTESSR